MASYLTVVDIGVQDKVATGVSQDKVVLGELGL